MIFLQNKLLNVGLVLSLSLLGLFIWNRFTPAPAPVEQWTEAVASAPVKSVSKVEIAPKKIKVYAKLAKAKLKLPDAIRQDDNQYVLASSTIAHSYRPQTVATVINSETGESTTITRREPYPWFSAEHTGEARIDYGIKNGGARVGRLTVREDLIQIKGINLGATATLDTDRDYFVGVGLGLRW